MSDPGFTGQYPGFDRGDSSGAASIINNTLQNIARQMGLWVAAYNGRIVGGTFTLTNATTTIVSQANVQAGSVIIPFATNATAALTMRTNGLYISARTAASTFSVSTQNGSALGTETFGYVIFTPS